MNSGVIQPDVLVDKIKQIQQSKGFTDQQMADNLGCSRLTYFKTRTGKVRVGNVFFRGAVNYLSLDVEQSTGVRSSNLKRKTKETKIEIEISIDGSGQYQVNTGICIFDHLISQYAKHGRFDIKIDAVGDDLHHVAEDIGICLGQAFLEALGEKRGITRMADATVPMDDSLAMVAVDVGGRGYSVLDLSFDGNDMLGFPTDLIRHFLESFAIEARINLHARIIYGNNDHHRAEVLFKALGRALDMATMIDNRISGELPTTKGLLEG